MYIPEFLCGVIATIAVELAAIIIGVVVNESKKGKEEHKDE